MPITPIKAPHATAPAGYAFVLLGLVPWAAAWLGSYGLHSAVASFLFYHLYCLIAALVIRRRLGRQEPVVLPRRLWIALAAGAVAIIGATYCVLPWLSGWLIDPAQIRAALARQGVGPARLDYVALIVYFALVNPVVEEMFWRGALYRTMRSGSLPVALSVALTAVLFGSWHWLIVRLFFSPAYAVLITLGIAGCGALFALAFERTRSLPFCAALHALAADVPVLVALWFGVLAKG